jgi:tetratricopeptide (TPR) repeat protein
MMRSLRILSSLFLGAAVLTGAAARTAVAQGEAAPDPALQQAKAAFEEAQILYTKDQFEAAAAKFILAFDKKPFSSFLFNAAVAYEKAKDLPKAIDTFQRYITVDPSARDAVEVKTRIDSLKAVLTPSPAGGKAAPDKAAAQVLPAIVTKGLVIIESKPAGANVYLDDPAKGVFATTPWQGSLEPRPVKLIFESKGFKRETREIYPRSDKVLELYISMSEEHFLGWIEVVSNVPGAEVFIDRQEIGAIGRTPYTGHLKPGNHTLWVQKSGYEVARKEIEVQPGTANTHSMNLELVGYGILKAGTKASEGGKLFVDGAQVCVLPCEQQLKPGEHALRVQKEEMENFDGKLAVNRADVTAMEMTYSPKPPRAKAWTEAAFSVAFFAGGIYLGVKGNQIKDEIASDIKDPSKLINSGDSRKTTGKIYYIGADVCFGLSLVTAALATWNLLESGPPSTATFKTTNVAAPNSNKLGFAPMSMPGGGGLAATGRF